VGGTLGAPLGDSRRESIDLLLLQDTTEAEQSTMSHTTIATTTKLLLPHTKQTNEYEHDTHRHRTNMSPLRHGEYDVSWRQRHSTHKFDDSV